MEQAIETVLLLISYGANVNAQTDERNDYRSVLHFAVLSGSHEMVELLLKQGARVQPQRGDPSLTKPALLDLAVLKGDIKLMKMLIDAGSSLPNRHTNTGQNENCYSPTGADVNNTSPVLGSALHVACADNVTNRVDVVRLLLEAGANPNVIVTTEDGIMLPCVLYEYINANGHKDDLPRDVVDLLLRHGALVLPSVIQFVCFSFANFSF